MSEPTEISTEAREAAKVIFDYCANIRCNGSFPDPNAEQIIQRAIDATIAAKDAEIAQNNERIDWLETQREVEVQQKNAALRESVVCLQETTALCARLEGMRKALGNCYIMAVRQVRRTNGENKERWEHIVRFCEETGCKADILRAQLPTEITDGALASSNPTDEVLKGFDTIRAENNALSIEERVKLDQRVAKRFIPSSDPIAQIWNETPDSSPASVPATETP